MEMFFGSHCWNAYKKTYLAWIGHPVAVMESMEDANKLPIVASAALGRITKKTIKLLNIYIASRGNGVLFFRRIDRCHC